MDRRRRLFRLRSSSRAARDREVREELEAHLEMRIEQLVTGGMSREAAREEALRRMGGWEVARSRMEASAAARDERLQRAGWWDAVRRDARLTGRRLRRFPGYALLVVVSLALGIGLTTTVFTVVDGVVFRPLPFPAADRLVALYSVGEGQESFPEVSSENWLDWRDGASSLESTAIHDQRRFTIGLEDRSVATNGLAVSGAFFETLGIPMRLGRAFTEDEVETEQAVVVVSEAFWNSVLGAPSELPEGLIVNGAPHQVVGVAVSGFEFPAGTEIWVPDAARRLGAFMRNNINWLAVGKLRAGVEEAEAERDLQRVADRIREEAPDGLYSWSVDVVPLKTSLVGDVSERMTLLLVAVAFVLLITCANVAGLGVAHTLARRQAIGIRVTLGAGRGEIVRQIVLEHLALCFAGGLLGVILAGLGTGLLVEWAGPLVPRADAIALDARVVLFAAAVTVLSAVLAATIPALQASGVSPASLLSGTTRIVGRRGLALSALVVGEVAIALLLLTGGGLFLRSFGRLVSTELGFDPRGVITADAVLNSGRYQGDDGNQLRVAYWDELLDELRGLPGVGAVGLGNWIPTGSGGRGFIEIPGRTSGESIGAGYRVVSDDYFDVLGIPLVRGRFFGEQDQLGTERVVLVNETMVAEYWPGRDPIGERVLATSMEGGFVANPTPELSVIGVVADIRHFGYDAPPSAEMYTLYRQVPPWTQSMAAVLKADPRRTPALTAQVRRIAAEVDPGTAVQVTTMDERLSELVQTPRFLMTILTGFAGLSLLLAALGIYGLLAFVVAQRIPEIGLRTALGASREAVLVHMLLKAGRVVAIGAGAGLVAALLLSRFLEGILYEIEPMDPFAYGMAAVVLLIVTGLAAFVPARRASRVDPLVALRSE